MKKLISLNGDGNWVGFDRGNDGDMHIIMEITKEHIMQNKSVICSVRVGVGNSGGQKDIPLYVKKALTNLVDAFQEWENEEQVEDDSDNFCDGYENKICEGCDL